MIKDSINVKGHVLFQQYDKDNNLKYTLNVDNLVVTMGKEYIASRIVGVAKNVISHIGLGSVDTPATSDQTALISPVGSRVAFTAPVLTGSNITLVATFLPGVATGSIREAGIFNAITSGDMLSRVKFGLITKPAEDTLVVTWNITVL